DGTFNVNITSENIEDGVNGSGIIARIKFREKSSINSGETIKLTLSDVSGLEESGSFLNITPQNVSYVTPDIQNTAPARTQLLAPSPGSNPGTNQPELTWQVPTDVDGDSLHFKVEIAVDSTFSEMIFSSPFESYVNIFGFTPVPPLVTGNCSFTLPYPLVNGQYYWRVTAWDGKTYGSSSKIEDFIIAPNSDENQENQLPEKLELAANYPNPFNPSTTIRYGLPIGNHVTIQIFDISGRKVRTLVDGQRDAGIHQVVWHADDDLGRQVSTGIYLCRMVAGNEVQHRKLIFTK
ncbi:T9SS type A sorting domain-containing protein, partial [bacterium]|nr:T9SS type A sorting domain-containing protein [bacterium]